jgi:nucleotide-binding universal stress UspA family protein
VIATVHLPLFPVGRPILAIGSPSPASANAVRRAGLIAREQGVALHVLQVEPDTKGLAEAQAAASTLCGQLQERLGIAIALEVTTGDLLGHVVREAQNASLLVIGSARDNALRERISGVSVDRLIRLCRVPTLVVKRQVGIANERGAPLPESGRYGRVLVAVDLEPTALRAVSAAAEIAPGARAEAFHSVSARGTHEASSPNAEHPGLVGSARLALGRLLAPIGSDGPVPAVGFGRPGDAVLARARATGAELVVLGKRQRGLLADFFLGSLTQFVLAGSDADILILPATRMAAADLPAGQGEGLRSVKPQAEG